MLHIYNKNNNIKVVIQDKINKDDKKKLIDILEFYKTIELSFLDIEFVDSIIINKIKEFENSLDLNTNNKTLWIYLKD